MTDRPRMPYIDLKNWAGLYTKSATDVLNPEQLKIAQNVDFFDRYGAVAKLKGSSNVISTQYKESLVAKPISWIGFYKAADLAGVILRHVLCASGTFLTRLNGTSLENVPNTSTSASSTSGRTSGLLHSADQLDRFLYLTNYNPEKVGEGDALLKYDGARFSNWGLTPPGSEETVEEPFSSAASFTSVGCTITDDTTTSFDGAAVKIVQTNNGTCSIAKTVTSFKVISDTRLDNLIGGVAQERLAMWVYIPRGQLDNANGTTVSSDSNMPRFFSIYLGADASNNWRFDYRKGDLVEGWNLVKIDIATAISNNGPVKYGVAGLTDPITDGPFGTKTGTFDPNPSGADTSVSYLKFEFVSNGTNLDGIRLDRFIRFNQGAPRVRVLGHGTVSGNYQYRISYVNKYGHESNCGPKSVTVTAANNAAFYLSFLPTSNDNQVTARRLYRTVAGGTIFLQVTELPDNSTSTFQDRAADGDLEDTTAPQAGDFSDDNSPPPKGGICKVWKRTMFMAGDPQNPTTLYYSDDDEMESFPFINSFDLDDKITAIYETYSGLVVETTTGKWQVIGDNPDFAVDKIIENMGCVGRRAAGTAKLLGYSVDQDGLRLYDLSDTAKVSEPIRDKYETLDKTNIEFINTVHSKARNSLVQWNPDSTTVSAASPPHYTSAFHYQYAVDDIRTGWWSTFSPDSSLNIISAQEIEDTNGAFHIYTGTDNGMLMEIITTTSDNWTKVDGTTSAVDTIFQTSYMRLGALGAEGEGVTGKVEPTYLEIRHRGDACIWTATIDVAEGPDQAQPTETTAITFNFGSNNSLLRLPIKFGNVVRSEYVRLTFENNQKDVDSSITAIRLYFHVREGQFPVTELKNTV